MIALLQLADSAETVGTPGLVLGWAVVAISLILVVWAIREGRQAARSVDAFLMGHSELPR